MPESTIAVVTALTPSSTTLAEYGLHFLTALGRKHGVRVVALVEDLPLAYPEIPGVEVRRAWRFGSATNPVRIARAARDAGADAVILNAHFTSFGSSKVAAALGLTTPLALRAVGVPVLTLLHNIVETVDLTAAGFRANGLWERVLRFIGTQLTRVVLTSDVVATTMPRYVDVLRAKYDAKNVVLTPHGSFDGASPAPVPGSPGSSGRTILTFGKFGTYKKVEQLIAALRMLGRPDVRLVIAGTDSPNTPGYLARVEREHGGADVEFIGYVPEEAVAELFQRSVLTVFPYTATTGSSGVLHQAGAFGCPPVLPRIGDLQDLVEDEGYAGAFFDPEDTADLARAIGELLDDPGERARLTAVNRAAATGLSLDDVADWHLIHLGRLLAGDPRSLLMPLPRKSRREALV